MNTGRPRQAEAAYQDGLALQKQLAADFPTRPEFRQQLAGSHNNLGILLRDTGRLKEAEVAYQNGLALYKQLAADFPNKPDLRNEVAAALVNLGLLGNQRREFDQARAYLEEALPYHEAALKANPRNPAYREFFRNNLAAMMWTCAGLRNETGAKRAAEKIRDLGWDPPGNAYDAASLLAQGIPFVQRDNELDAARRQAAVTFYGDEAMKLLRDAVNKGFKNAAQMKKDAGLNPLRQRDDFKKLLAELEGKTNEKPAPEKK
jgi:tetratricopeptide (TPR) repeat protein